MFAHDYKSQYINGQREKFFRMDGPSLISPTTSDIGRNRRSKSIIYGIGSISVAVINFFLSGSVVVIKSLLTGFRSSMRFIKSLYRSNPSGASRTAFAEDLKNSKRLIFDPQGKFLLRMNRVFFGSCLIAAAIDPLFLYLPVINANLNCIGIDRKLGIAATVARTVIDLIYVIHMFLQFRTAFVPSSSRPFGEGELVIDPGLICKRYFMLWFPVDLISVLPLPQIVVWKFLQSADGSVLATKNALRWIVLFQYMPRLLRILPLTTSLKKVSGVFIGTAWAGAAYYLLLYMLAGHSVGTFWYLLSIERASDCWHLACGGFPGCNDSFLYCSNNHQGAYQQWLENSSSILSEQCPYNSSAFNFGIYQPALQYGIASVTDFPSKVIYCFWWGLQSLCTLGQALLPSTYPGETIFSIFVCVLGLLLFAFLVAKIQSYLQSLYLRLEERRVEKRDTEQWMEHRHLPPDIKDRVRQYDQYRWLETGGVDEESLIQTLPKDLQRAVKQYLCLGLVKRVPLFEDMDAQLLDALLERLKPTLYIENAWILREGDPVDEMLFVARGCLESVTTDGGRSGFFNQGLLKEGDFCGEELLTWALDPKSSPNFPTSTRTVKALSKVEAFALAADDLKYVASQFRRLHSRKLQHTFRFYSQQWQTWAARFIQAAWRRYRRRKAAELRQKESLVVQRRNAQTSLGAAIYVSRFAATALRGVHRLRERAVHDNEILRLEKPPEPDFGGEETDQE